MKTPVVTIVSGDSERLAEFRSTIQDAIFKLEENLLETVKRVGSAILGANELFGHDPLRLRAWVDSDLDGSMTYANARKWMKYVQALKTCPALELIEQGRLGVAARTVFSSALLQDRISSDQLETVLEGLPVNGKITQLQARDLVKKLERLSSLTAFSPRVLKAREPDDLFDLHAVDFERVQRENPSLAAALEQARKEPVMPDDPRLNDVVNGLGGWDDFIVWLAAFRVSSDPRNPPTPNPPELARRFVLVDEDGRGTKKALKLFSLLVQAAQVLDLTL